jgi:hypothetical protein
MIYGDVFATSPELEGIAVWLPSKKSEITLWRAFLRRQNNAAETA